MIHFFTFFPFICFDVPIFAHFFSFLFFSYLVVYPLHSPVIIFDVILCVYFTFLPFSPFFPVLLFLVLVHMLTI